MKEKILTLEEAERLMDSKGVLDITDLGYSFIEGLPEGLVDFRCYGNNLTSLPPLPKGLVELRCYDNNLTSLPPLPKGLVKLGCGDNKLTSLPSLPEGLVVLWVGKNPLPKYYGLEKEQLIKLLLLTEDDYLKGQLSILLRCCH